MFDISTLRNNTYVLKNMQHRTIQWLQFIGKKTKTFYMYMQLL